MDRIFFFSLNAGRCKLAQYHLCPFEPEENEGKRVYGSQGFWCVAPAGTVPRSLKPDLSLCLKWRQQTAEYCVLSFTLQSSKWLSTCLLQGTPSSSIMLSGLVSSAFCVLWREERSKRDLFMWNVFAFQQGSCWLRWFAREVAKEKVVRVPALGISSQEYRGLRWRFFGVSVRLNFSKAN